MLLIPSISVIKNRMVRLVQGDFDNEKAYEKSPVDFAQEFEAVGIKRIHFVDLEGAKKGSPVNYHVAETIANYTNLKINYSGGIHNDGDVSKVFESGAESITSATIAVYDQEMFYSWLMSYGREKITLGADVLGDYLRVGGWQKDTKIKLVDHVGYFYDRGLKYLKTTDIARDGGLEGPAFDLYKTILREFPSIQLYASGGIRSMDDVKNLADIGVHGAIFGKAFYENKITLKDLEAFNSKQ